MHPKGDPDGPSYQSVWDVIVSAFSKDKKKDEKVRLKEKRPEDKDQDEEEYNW